MGTSTPDPGPPVETPPSARVLQTNAACPLRARRYLDDDVQSETHINRQCDRRKPYTTVSIWQTHAYTRSRGRPTAMPTRRRNIQTVRPTRMSGAVTSTVSGTQLIHRHPIQLYSRPTPTQRAKPPWCVYIQVGFHGDHYRSSCNRISITIGGHHGRDAWSANLSVWLWSVDCIVFFDKFDSMHRSGSLAPLYAIIYMVVLAQRIRKQEVIINGY